MSVRDEHESLLAFIGGGAQYINLVLGSVTGDPGGDLEQLFTLERVNIADDVVGDFYEIARGTTTRDADRRFVDYTPGFGLRNDELAYLEVRGAEAEAGAAAIAAVADVICEVDALNAFAADPELVAHPRFYAIVLQGNGECAVFFRIYSPQRELTRSRSLALIGTQGQYDRVRDPVFLFDPQFDCYVWQQYAFIRSVTQFQRLFGYFERLRVAAGEVVDAIANRIPLANLDAFRTAVVGQEQMMSKLAQVAQKPYFAAITLEDLRRAIDEFALDVQIDGQDRLVFESAPDKRWLIPNLLDDDYLGSVMTDLKYEVNSKRQV